jgi:hypothetical protein
MSKSVGFMDGKISNLISDAGLAAEAAIVGAAVGASFAFSFGLQHLSSSRQEMSSYQHQ